MNFTVLILCVVGGLLAVGMIFNMLGSMGKSMRKTPAEISEQAQRIQDQQHQQAEDSRLKQKELMEQMRQKMSDNNMRRF